MKLPHFYLKLNKDNSWHMDRPHFHEDVEFLIPVTSGDELFVENNVYPLQPGVMFIMPDATLHKTLASSSYERYVLHVPTQVLADLSTPQTDFLERVNKAEHVVYLGDNASYFVELLQQLEHAHEYHGKQFGEDMDQYMILMTFLLKALSLSISRPSQQKPAAKENNSAQINQVLTYLQDHMSEKLTLDDIAGSFYISKYHLSHCFKLATGFSVMEYLINIRIIKARQLLREGVRVQDAGEAVGFQSNEHFIRTFSSITGTSPKKYTRRFMESDKC